GTGQTNGNREGRNTEPCTIDGAGYGTGEGRGGRKNRKDKQ
ncbi:unnamed protein product, partial [marine sediment metagenome]